VDETSQSIEANAGRRVPRSFDRRPRVRQPAPVRRLSSTLDRLADRYDVVVVGSGYGGAIVAARLAAAGRSVCILERGRELLPGDFPRSLWGALRQLQWRKRGRRHGARSGLFDLRAGHDVSVLVGCGLGGTSLINAGVALRPPAWVFDDARWPMELRGQGSDVLDPYLARAEQMLGVTHYPEAWPRLPKLAALSKAAAAIGGHVEPTPVAVTFGAPDGSDERGCQLCGDCVTGCNYGAKNTVTTNYLPLAVAHGAQIFTEAEVRTVLPAAESASGAWTVAFESTADQRGRFGGAPSLFIHADAVVLAAGSLGSTEILFRSRAAGLPVSPRLGHGFSGNGDALAFAYDADAPVRGLGLGRRPPAPETAVGPCITGMIRVPDGDGELIVEEGVVPGSLRNLLPAAFAMAAEADEPGGALSFPRRVLRRLRRSSGALERTLTYLVMGDDRGEGRLTYRPGEGGAGAAGAVEVEWACAGDQAVYDRGDDLLRRASAAIGAELVRNPFSSPAFHDSVITVHPLGGCAMADDGATGVVDHRGRVFTGTGDTVHEGLAVVDGAIVPRPLAVNPLLTISALAERAAELMVDDLVADEPPALVALLAEADSRPPDSWIDELAPFLNPRSHPTGPGPSGPTGLEPLTPVASTAQLLDRPEHRNGKRGGAAVPPRLAARPRPTPGAKETAAPSPAGLRFTERMRGHLGPVAVDTPLADREDRLAACTAGAGRGQDDGTTIEFVLTVGIDDLQELLDDPAQPGSLAGTVVAPLLSPHRMLVVDGRFQLFCEDPTHVDSWLMRYTMSLVAEDGQRFRFEGTKVLHDRAGLDAWSDTTTLYVTITSEDLDRRLVAAGIMRLGPGDFARQLTSMKVTGVEGRLARLRWLARFDARFLRSLLKVYGGPLDDVAEFPPAAPQPLALTGDGYRKLRLPQPEPRWCDGAGRWHEGNDLGDDAWLRLTRFEGGRRGPVLLAPGFGMSATSFLVSTVETNLVEYLVAKGYDVWLFDYRSGIDLPSASRDCTLDDIATRDWPAAVAEVLRMTDAGSVQVVAHCFGSVTYLMAQAAGLQGVRSAVSLHVTLHPVTSMLNQVKMAVDVGGILDKLGFKTVSPLRGTTVVNTALDLALRAVPLNHDERCGKSICRWVNAIFGSTHRHEQLNDATHELMDRLFGVADLAAMDHIAEIVQRRAAVDASGADVYLSHPERMRLPLLLLHGERNAIFHPEGSLRTLRWLQANNDPSLYERVVIPGYAHLDTLIGRDAAVDVFPVIGDHLDRFNR